MASNSHLVIQRSTHHEIGFFEINQVNNNKFGNSLSVSTQQTHIICGQTKMEFNLIHFNMCDSMAYKKPQNYTTAAAATDYGHAVRKIPFTARPNINSHFQIFR